MDRRVSLPRDPTSVGLARKFAKDTIEQWGVAVDLAAVELATSEVVTNAVVHGEGEVGLTLRLKPDSVRVEVADASRRRPVLHQGPPDATSGRGITIVATVADRWGVEDIADNRKAVWFTVAAHR